MDHAHDDSAVAQPPVCYRHSDRETRLSCNECGKYICHECSRDAAVGQKCPECAKPVGRNRVVDARHTVGTQTDWRTAPFSFGMLVVIVAIFILDRFGGIDWFFDNLAQINFFIDASNPVGEQFGRTGEWWRIFSAALLHADFIHLGLNGYVLYILGPRLERQIGTFPFAALYVAAAAGGSAVSYFTSDISGSSIGASGAIFGLFGAWMVVAYKSRRTPAGRAMLNQFGVLLLINLLFPLFEPRIDWRAHLGGLVAGLLIAAAWSRLAAGKPNAVPIRTAVATVFIAAALLAVLLFSHPQL